MSLDKNSKLSDIIAILQECEGINQKEELKNILTNIGMSVSDNASMADMIILLNESDLNLSDIIQRLQNIVGGLNEMSELSSVLNEKNIETSTDDSLEDLILKVKDIKQPTGDAEPDDVIQGKIFSNKDNIDLIGTATIQSIVNNDPSQLNNLDNYLSNVGSSEQINSSQNTVAFDIDNDYFYIVPFNGNIIRKYSKNDMSLILTSTNANNNTCEHIAVDDTYIYIIAGINTTSIYKLLKSDLSLISQYGINHNIYFFTVDDDYLYYNDYNYDDGNTHGYIGKHNKIDYSLIGASGQTYLSDGLETIKIDNDYIYCTSNNGSMNNYNLLKYSKTDLSLISSISETNNIVSFDIDDSYIYASIKNVGLKIYDKNNLSFVSQINNDINITQVNCSNTYIYTGDSTGLLKRYLKTNLNNYDYINLSIGITNIKSMNNEIYLLTNQQGNGSIYTHCYKILSLYKLI